MPAQKVRTLNPVYDLTRESDLELAQILKELCESYEKCRYEVSTATGDVWTNIKRIAAEIVRRG